MSSQSPAELLDRSDDLRALGERFSGVVNRGLGHLVLVSGEAGVGKTALVRRFCDDRRGSARVLWGACDPVFTPRALGPLLDIAQDAGGELAGLVEQGAKPYDVTLALRRELARRPPAILVVEDAHWADEATLDVLRLLGRRVEGVHALVIATYRDDELDRWHPLRIILGELGSGGSISRIKVSRLSLHAVATLARPYGADAEQLYKLTGGNPFFVTEALAAGEDPVPPTVRDAVLSRFARLSPQAAALVEAVAIVPPQAELWLLKALAGKAIEHLEECLAQGIVTVQPSGVAFRHEIARLAIEESIRADRRLVLHRTALAALSASPAGASYPARLAHHAEAADDPEAVLRFAPAAAAQASSLGAHREAAIHLARALRFADVVPVQERASLFLRRAQECFLTTQFEEAAAAQSQGLRCYEELGDRRKQGGALAWLSQLLWQTGSLPEAMDVAHRSLTLLEELPAGRELAFAHSTMATLLLAAEDPDAAMASALKAHELGERLDDLRTRVLGLRSVGWVEFFTGTNGGLDKLERSLELALEAGLEADVAATYVVIVRTAIRRGEYKIADRHLPAGIEFCSTRDFDVWRYYLISWLAKLQLARGQWAAAADSAAICLGKLCPFSRIHALVALGLVRARRGDPDPWTPLDEALALAEPRHELQWIAPVAMARAEAAWLEGRNNTALQATESAFEFSRQRGASWSTGLSYWRWHAGSADTIRVTSDEPYGLEMAGDWALAAERWTAMGCPYEAAMALAAADDDEVLLRAIGELQRLGARPATAMVARKLRERGVRGLPRGPRASTRENAAGLTQRQREVLVLVAEGLRNSDIAERLFLSKKTVDHHVSAVLGKIGARTRGEAVAEAARRGLSGSQARTAEQARSLRGGS